MTNKRIDIALMLPGSLVAVPWCICTCVFGIFGGRLLYWGVPFIMSVCGLVAYARIWRVILKGSHGGNSRFLLLGNLVALIVTVISSLILVYVSIMLTWYDIQRPNVHTKFDLVWYLCGVLLLGPVLVVLRHRRELCLRPLKKA